MNRVPPPAPPKLRYGPVGLFIFCLALFAMAATDLVFGRGLTWLTVAKAAGTTALCLVWFGIRYAWRTRRRP